MSKRLNMGMPKVLKGEGLGHITGPIARVGGGLLAGAMVAPAALEKVREWVEPAIDAKPGMGTDFRKLITRYIGTSEDNKPGVNANVASASLMPGNTAPVTDKKLLLWHRITLAQGG